ncbi:hypothetical protein KQI63_11475 [bacterium]|nr:hypothetical protein [bacterium]
MKRTFLLIAFVATIPLMTQPTLAAAKGEALETAVLDSIAANHWRTQPENVLESFRVRSASKMLDGDGDVKREDLTWQWIEVDEDGTRTIHVTDSTGIPLPDEVPQVQKPDDEVEDGVKQDDEKVEMSVSIGPLDPVLPENRGNHRFYRLPDPGPGLISFRTETINEDMGGFDATYIIDTTTWTPTEVSGSPVPMPDKKVKEMALTIHYQPWREQYAFPSEVSTKVTAKWLLFTFRMQMEQEFFERVARE